MIARVLRLSREGLRWAWQYLVAADALALTWLQTAERRYWKPARVTMTKHGPKLVPHKRKDAA